MTIGLVALLGGMTAPLVIVTDASGSSWPAGPSLGLSTLAMLAVPLAIVSPLAYAFRVLGTRREAIAWRARIVLGEPLGIHVTAQARRGVSAGMVASGVGLVAGVGWQVVADWATLGGSGVAHFEAWGVPTLAVTLAVCVAVTAVVYALAAGRVASAPMGASAARAAEGAPSRSETRIRLWMWRGLAALTGASFGLLAWDRIWFARGSASDSVASGLTAAVGYATFAFLVGGALLLMRGVAFASAALSRRTAGALASRPLGAAFAAAADGLAHRSRVRVLAAGTIATVLVIVACVGGTVAVNDARSSVAATLSPPFIVAALDPSESFDTAPGYEPQALPTSLVDAIEGDARIVSVPFGVLWGAAEPVTDPAAGAAAPDSVLVVDPARLTAVSPDGLRPLGLQDGTVTRGNGAGLANGILPWETGPAALDLPAGPLAAFALPTAAFDAFGTEAWAEPAAGAAPVTGMMLWPAAGVTRDELDAAITAHVGDTGARIWEISGIHGSLAAIGLRETGLLYVLLAIGVALTVALAASSARDRRTELATLAALGARSASLRWVPALEAGVTIACAALIALPTGFVLAMLGTHPTLLRAGAPLDAVETLWDLGWELAHLGWTMPVLLAAVALAGGVVAAGIVGATMLRGTPVDELREAEKEGAL
ncbi:FtsX-like permease family protein [Demequina soli]|uniref:FtsX-like permease family protein n=1 Tax=Demequina soli TaxID=1638987 RepID=UPI0007851FF8|nr:FtsX-like permease family protein [Demequina soli]